MTRIPLRMARGGDASVKFSHRRDVSYTFMVIDGSTEAYIAGWDLVAPCQVISPEDVRSLYRAHNHFLRGNGLTLRRPGRRVFSSPPPKPAPLDPNRPRIRLADVDAALRSVYTRERAEAWTDGELRWFRER